MSAKNPREVEDPAAGRDVDVTVRLPGSVYAALRSVAHDEGRSVEEQARRAIEEMLRERKRRPLFD